MIAPPSGVKVWLATGTTDMRRGMNGLSLQVQQALQRDPHAGDVYVFRGRRGKCTTFHIQFAACDGYLSLASTVRTDAASLAASARQGPDMHLYK